MYGPLYGPTLGKGYWPRTGLADWDMLVMEIWDPRGNPLDAEIAGHGGPEHHLEDFLGLEHVNGCCMRLCQGTIKSPLDSRAVLSRLHATFGPAQKWHITVTHF